MNPDWLPDWWTQSPAFQWLAGPGRWLLPSLLHAASVGLGVAALRLCRQLPHKERPPAERAIRVVLFLQLLVFTGSLAALDMGLSYYYGSGFSALVAALMAFGTMHLVKNARLEPASIERHPGPDFARLPANEMPERTP